MCPTADTEKFKRLECIQRKCTDCGVQLLDKQVLPATTQVKWREFSEEADGTKTADGKERKSLQLVEVPRYIASLIMNKS